MKELVRDPGPRIVPTKFDRDPIRNAPERAVTVWGNARPPARQATTIPLEPNLGWGVKIWILWNFPVGKIFLQNSPIFQNRGHPVNGILLMDWCYMLKARIKTGIKTSCWPYTESGLVVNKVKGPIDTCILCKVVGCPQWPKQADQKYKALPNESPLTQLRWRTVQIFHFG